MEPMGVWYYFVCRCTIFNTFKSISHLENHHHFIPCYYTSIFSSFFSFHLVHCLGRMVMVCTGRRKLFTAPLPPPPLLHSPPVLMHLLTIPTWFFGSLNGFFILLPLIKSPAVSHSSLQLNSLKGIKTLVVGDREVCLTPVPGPGSCEKMWC